MTEITVFSAMETTYQCAYCGELNDLFVDPGGGVIQRMVEDCQVCCQPNALTIELAEDSVPVVIARRENE